MVGRVATYEPEITRLADGGVAGGLSERAGGRGQAAVGAPGWALTYQSRSEMEGNEAARDCWELVVQALDHVDALVRRAREVQVA